jgi:hypothetical protein
MESLQKFFYDLFLGVNWDKGYCETKPEITATQPVDKQEPVTENISAALLPLAATAFKRRKLRPSNQ